MEFRRVLFRSANGNRIQVERNGPVKSAVDLVALTASYDKNNLSSTNILDYTRDNEGQRSSSSDGLNYTFDSRHRLVSTSNTDYLYDGASNRLQSNHNGIITRYIYDAQGNLIAEADQNNTITRYYIHGLGLLATEYPFGQSYTYHFDANSNTVALTRSEERRVGKECRL